MDKVIIFGAIILNFLSIIKKVLSDMQIFVNVELTEGKKCVNLRDDVCSDIVCKKIFYDKKTICSRHKCVGFAFELDGKKRKVFSIWNIMGVILNNFPAIATTLLLFLQI